MPARRRPATPALPGFEPPPVPHPRRARRGVSAQLAAQRKLGQIEAIDAGVIAVARILADLVDDEIADDSGSRYTAGMLAGRLQVALERLRGDRYVGADAEGVDAELAQLVAALRDTPRPDTSDAG